MGTPASNSGQTKTRNRRPRNKRPDKVTTHNDIKESASKTTEQQQQQLLEVYVNVGNLPDGYNEKAICNFFNLYLSMETSEEEKIHPSTNSITSTELSPPHAWLECASSYAYTRLLALDGKLCYYTTQVKIEPSRRKPKREATPNMKSTHQLQAEAIDDLIMSFLLSNGGSSLSNYIGNHIKSAGLQDDVKKHHGGLRKFLQQRPHKYSVVSDPTIRSDGRFSVEVAKPVDDNNITTNTRLNKLSEDLEVLTASLKHKNEEFAALHQENQERILELSSVKAALHEASIAINDLNLKSLQDKICGYVKPGIPTCSTDILKYLDSSECLDLNVKAHEGLKILLQQLQIFSIREDVDDDIFWVTRFISKEERLYVEIAKFLQTSKNKHIDPGIIGTLAKSLGLSSLVKEAGGVGKFLRQRQEYFQVQQKGRKSSVILVKDYKAMSVDNTDNNTHEDLEETKRKMDELKMELDSQASRCMDLEDTNRSLQESNQQYQEKEKHHLNNIEALRLHTINQSKQYQSLQSEKQRDIEALRLSFETEKEDITKTVQELRTNLKAKHSELELALSRIKELERIVKRLELTQRPKNPDAPPSAKLTRLQKELHETQEKLKKERHNNRMALEQSQPKKKLLTKENTGFTVTLGDHLPKKVPYVNANLTTAHTNNEAGLSELAASVQQESAPIHFNLEVEEDYDERLTAELSFLTSAYSSEEIKVDGRKIIRRLLCKITTRKDPIEVDLSLTIPKHYPARELRVAAEVVGNCPADGRKCVLDAIPEMVDLCRLEAQACKGQEAIQSVLSTAQSWMTSDWPRIQAKHFPPNEASYREGSGAKLCRFLVHTHHLNDDDKIRHLSSTASKYGLCGCVKIGRPCLIIVEGLEDNS
eukprot:scaffold27544_cov78-Skeletonema_dohrnii-CCMP3373.AAC.6